MSAALIAVGVFLGIRSIRRRNRPIEIYLGLPDPTPPRRIRVPSPGAALVGAVTGTIGALAIAPDRVPALAVIGSLAGMLVSRAMRSTAAQRRSTRLLQELPTVADTIALHIMAGESVPTAVYRLTRASAGVASSELAHAISSEEPLDQALRSAARDTAHPEAARLYDLLSHAHRTGGALADSLGALAADYRARLVRDLTEEGGRRAIAVYGPILALMVPVTLLFLMYPTLAGLTALSSTP